MSRPSARIVLLRVLTVAALLMPAWPALAQQPALPPAQPDSTRPDSPKPAPAAPDSVRLDAIPLALDRAEAAFKREGLSVQALFDLGQGLAPLREELQAKIGEFEPRLAQIDVKSSFHASATLLPHRVKR